MLRWSAITVVLVLACAKHADFLRTADSSGEIGFELQFNMGQYISPANTNDASATAMFIATALDQVAHASEQNRRSSTELEHHPNFDLTTDHVTDAGVGGCKLSKIWHLPGVLTCAHLEVISRPLPLHHAKRAADDIQAYFADFSTTTTKSVRGNGPTTLLAFNRDHQGSGKNPSLVLSTVPRLMSCQRGIRTYCSPHLGPLLNASVFPQSTVAVPLHKLRQFLAAAVDPLRVLNTSSKRARAISRSSLHAPKPSHFSQFLARVNRVCQVEALPEVYCGMLVLSGHLLRSVGRLREPPLDVFHAKYAMLYAALPDILPVIPRSNLASAWAHVRKKLEREERPSLAPSTLAATFAAHMELVLFDDPHLPLGLQTTLFDWPLKTYEYGTVGHFMRVVLRLSPTLHAKGFDAAVEWLTRSASQEDRMHFTSTFEQISANNTVRLARADGAPFCVADWIRLLVEEGRDALSDSGSSFSVPVFKSMGSWAVGDGGKVHLEFTRFTFEKHWDHYASITKGWLSVHAALDAYRAHVKDVHQILYHMS